MGVADILSDQQFNIELLPMIYMKGTIFPQAQWSLVIPGKFSQFLPPRCMHKKTSVYHRAILHDEATFPEPDVFKPERFLPTSADDSTKIPFPDAAFGYGRRICPGRYMARDAVWIAMVSILASFEITKAVDDEGKEIEPKDEFTSGIIS